VLRHDDVAEQRRPAQHQLAQIGALVGQVNQAPGLGLAEARQLGQLPQQPAGGQQPELPVQQPRQARHRPQHVPEISGQGSDEPVELLVEGGGQLGLVGEVGVGVWGKRVGHVVK